MAETCLASSKPYLLAALLLAFSFAARAETGLVNASGTGRDTPDAITNLLKSTVGKYFRDTPASLSRPILQTEILPNASSFVQSYKITEGGRSGAVTLSASVDLDVIQGLFSLTPKSFGETEGAKSLVMVRGAKLPDSALAGMKPGTSVPDPFATLAEAARERFLRRNFAEATLTAEDMQAVGAGEDVSSPELLRGLGAKAGARVALGITARFENYENENSHNKEERLVLSAAMVDVSGGNVIARSSANVVTPKTRKEIYVADLQRAILEESKDLFQDLFVAAGRRLVRAEGQSEFAILRVQSPPSAPLVAKFRTMLEANPGIRSVVEHSVRRGKFDFAIRPALGETALTKLVVGLPAPDILISPLQPMDGEPEAHPPVLTVRLAPKEAAVPTEVEGGAANGTR